MRSDFGEGPEDTLLSLRFRVERTVPSSSLLTMSERGGPLAQERLYKYRSGWRQRTSGKPRTVLLHARRSYTVAEGERCTLCEICEPQRTLQASPGMEMRHRRGAPSCRPGGGCFPVEYLATAS